MYRKALSVIFLVFILASCGQEPCEKKNCKDFKSQRDAQEAYDEDPDCYKNLDKDDDGIACESLP